MRNRRKKSSTLGVTTVTPSYNDKEKVYRLLDSIKKSDYKDIESIVVVGGKGDTLEEGPKKYPWVKWIDAGPIDASQTGKYNLGFAYANPKNHILYIDSDVILEPDMISKIIKRLSKSKNVGVVTPMILYLEDKDWVNQAGANVDLWTGRVSIGWGPRKDYLNAKKVQGSGTVMLFNRKLVDSIGCFDDWNMCYFDPDYCVRALRAGFENWYEPESICYHDQSKNPDNCRPRVLSRAWLLGKNRTLFMKKHGRSILVYLLFQIPLMGYYLIESVRYGIFKNWIALVNGTIVGLFTPVNKDLYIPIPKPFVK